MPRLSFDLDLLRLPAIAAPMTGVSTPQLVAEACAAGIIGAFPTSNAPSSAALHEWFDEIDQLLAARPTVRPTAPIIANLIVGRQNQRLDADVAEVIAQHVQIVITSVGSPAPVIEPLHQAGTFVFADVASLTHARKIGRAHV